MIIKSAPPASANLAEMPVPAPQPTIGRPGSVLGLKPAQDLLSGDRHIEGSLLSLCLSVGNSGWERRGPYCSSAQHLQQQRHRLLGKLRVVDVGVHLDQRDVGAQVILERVDTGAVRGRGPRSGRLRCPASKRLSAGSAPRPFPASRRSPPPPASRPSAGSPPRSCAAA